jgi:hypothetical protein
MFMHQCAQPTNFVAERPCHLVTACLRDCGCRRFYAALVLAELMRSDEEPRQVAAAFKLPQGQVEAMQDKAGARSLHGWASGFH